MNDLILPAAYQDMLRKACERAYKKGLRRGKRAGHANGHAAGRDEVITGLKALAKLNGTGEPIMRVTKAFDESKHPRDEHGRFATGQEIAEAAADPAKRKELEAGMDAENKQKLAAAIAEHKGGEGAKDTGLTPASSAHQGAVALDKLAKAFKAKQNNDPGWQKQYTDAIDHAANEIGKMTRDELGKLKEAIGVKAGGKKAEIARAIATKAIAAGHTGSAREQLAPAEPTPKAPELRPETRAVMGHGEGEPAAPVPTPAPAAKPAAHSITSAAYWIERRAKEGRPLSPEAAAILQDREKAGAMITGGDVKVAEAGGRVEAPDLAHESLFRQLNAEKSRRENPPELAGNLPVPTKFGDEPHYVTGGSTFQHRKELSAIGARWDQTLRRWVIPKAKLGKLPPGLHGVPL